MKIKSEDELMRLIEMAREHGTVSFLSDNLEGDRQKLYRIIRTIESMPLFPSEYEFVVRAATREKIITIDRKDQITTIIVGRPQKATKQITVEKQVIKKQPAWLKQWRDEIKLVEEKNPSFIQGNPNCRDAWEYFDTLKNIMDTYMDLDDDELLEKAIRGTYEDFTTNLVAAFLPQYVKPKVVELTRREELAKRMGEIRNSQDPADIREFGHLLEEHERLIKREDEQWTSDPKNLLG